MAYDSEQWGGSTPILFRDPLTLETARERLEYLRDFFRHLAPERFDMTAWYRDSEGKEDPYSRISVNECGTSACICGWVNSLFTKDQTAGNMYGAAVILDLSPSDTMRLFYGGANTHNSDFEAQNRTTLEAANAIDHYLQRGYVSWR